jgi:hypothetical protein
MAPTMKPVGDGYGDGYGYGNGNGNGNGYGYGDGYGYGYGYGYGNGNGYGDGYGYGYGNGYGNGNGYGDGYGYGYGSSTASPHRLRRQAPAQPVPQVWPEGFFPITPSWDQHCASVGCGQRVSIRLEVGGIGSVYCEPCARKIAALSPAQPAPMEKT